MNVDHKAALMASQEWWEEDAGIADVAQAIPQLKSAELTNDDSYLQSGTGAAKRAHCSNTEHPGHKLFVTVQVYADKIDDAQAMEKMTAAYTQSVENSATCQ